MVFKISYQKICVYVNIPYGPKVWKIDFLYLAMTKIENPRTIKKIYSVKATEITIFRNTCNEERFAGLVFGIFKSNSKVLKN